MECIIVCSEQSPPHYTFIMTFVHDDHFQTLTQCLAVMIVLAILSAVVLIFT